jgi:hypothetical protein
LHVPFRFHECFGHEYFCQIWVRDTIDWIVPNRWILFCAHRVAWSRWRAIVRLRYQSWIEHRLGDGIRVCSATICIPSWYCARHRFRWLMIGAVIARALWRKERWFISDCRLDTTRSSFCGKPSTAERRAVVDKIMMSVFVIVVHSWPKIDRVINRQAPFLQHDQIVESLAVDDSLDFYEKIRSKMRTRRVLKMIVAAVETIKIATVFFVSTPLFVWGLSTDCYDSV